MHYSLNCKVSTGLMNEYFNKYRDLPEIVKISFSTSLTHYS